MFTFVEIGHLCPLCNIDHDKLRYQDRAHCAFFPLCHAKKLLNTGQESVPMSNKRHVAPPCCRAGPSQAAGKS